MFSNIARNRQRTSGHSPSGSASGGLRRAARWASRALPVFVMFGMAVSAFAPQVGPVDAVTPTEAAEMTAEPTIEPTAEATIEPTTEPTLEPTAEPTVEPTAAPAPTIQSDKADYAPGETVTLTGANWRSAEAVHLFVNDDVGSTWSHSADVVAGEDGRFSYSFALPTWFVATYSVTATGAGSGVATTTFTDAVTSTIEQCQDDTNNDNVKDACEWINGSINSGISAYREGDSVAFRTFLDGLVPDTDNTITIRYDFTKQTSGGKIVLGYDYLTSPDTTEQATVNKCVGIPGGVTLTLAQCNALSLSTQSYGSDPFIFSNTLSGVNAGLAGQAIAIRESGTRLVSIYGATGVSVSAITKFGDPNLDGASQSELTLSFHTPASGEGCTTKGQTTTCAVEILWAAHLAKGTTDTSGWGAATGASSFPGSSLSMRLQAVNGDSAGATNRSIQPDAVIPPGTIIINKVTSPFASDPQDFGYTGSGAIGTFALDTDTSDATLQSTQSFTVLDGVYGVTETVPPGWTLTSATCSDGSPVSAIVVSPGETVTCTYTNTKSGRIIVDKVTSISGDPTVFAFTTTGSGYLGFTLTDAAEPNEQTLASGSYSVSETEPVGWDLESATCVSSNLDAETPGSISLQAGETVTCTFENEKAGSIVIVKNTLGGNGTFDFTSTTLTPGAFSLTTVGNTASKTFSDLDVDPTYDVSETVPAGWELNSATCDNGETIGSIDLEPGETVTCTFENEKAGSIVIVKNTLGGNGTFDFTSTTLTPGAFSLTTVGNTASKTFSDLDVDPTYDVSETVPAGWELNSATCDNGETIGSIDLEPGETVTCTFENEKAGSIVIVKNTLGGNGTFDFTSTTLTPGAFSLTTVGNTASKTFSDLDVDPTYDVSETVPAGWELNSATCDNGETIGSIDLEPGETVTCTFENEKAGSIVIVKNTLGGNGTFDFTSTTLTPGAFSLTTVGNTASKTFSDLDV